MELTREQVLAYRWGAHHLAEKLPLSDLLAAAGACGLQNTPPGAAETALWNRVEGITLEQIQRALCQQKTLVQAWSLRGAPWVFPTEKAGQFLAALIPQGEEPWVYTLGIGQVLDPLALPQGQLLDWVRQSVAQLEAAQVRSKNALDALVAQGVEPLLPPDALGRWRAPSPFGSGQTMGQAAASFLLRPCSLEGRVLFEGREGSSPVFTGPVRWLGGLENSPQPAALVESFLHCYGPAKPPQLATWLGVSPGQARRLWGTLHQPPQPVQCRGQRGFVLARDLPQMAGASLPPAKLQLLGPHDPYLDGPHRDLLLPEIPLQRQVWKTSVNPGAILWQGGIIGLWKRKTVGSRCGITAQFFCQPTLEQRRQLEEQAQSYVNFWGLQLAECHAEM